MNGVRMQGLDDLRARVALALAGYNLARDVSAAVQNLGPQRAVKSLAVPDLVLEMADEILAICHRSGVAVLTAASPIWPWARSAVEAPSPLVLWAKGQLDVLDEPLIRVTEGECTDVSAEWGVAEVATGLSDAGHVLIAATDSAQGQLVLRAARAMGGRWVAVSNDLLRDIGLAPRGSSTRGVVVSATAPVENLHRHSGRDTADLMSRLASVTVDPARGRPTSNLGGLRMDGSFTVLR